MTDLLKTKKQVKKIESLLPLKKITKCGYNRNMATDIGGGPKELGGAGFYSFKKNDWSGKNTTFHKELENTKRRYQEGTTYSNVTDPI